MAILRTLLGTTNNNLRSIRKNFEIQVLYSLYFYKKYSRIGLYTAFRYKTCTTGHYSQRLLIVLSKTTCNEKRLPAIILNKLHRPNEKRQVMDWKIIYNSPNIESNLQIIIIEIQFELTAGHKALSNRQTKSK